MSSMKVHKIPKIPGEKEYIIKIDRYIYIYYFGQMNREEVMMRKKTSVEQNRQVKEVIYVNSILC